MYVSIELHADELINIASFFDPSQTLFLIRL